MPWVMMVLSKATTGWPSASAWDTSGCTLNGAVEVLPCIRDPPIGSARIAPHLRRCAYTFWSIPTESQSPLLRQGDPGKCEQNNRHTHLLSRENQSTIQKCRGNVSFVLIKLSIGLDLMKLKESAIGSLPEPPLKSCFRGGSFKGNF